MKRRPGSLFSSWVCLYSCMCSCIACFQISYPVKRKGFLTLITPTKDWTTPAGELQSANLLAPTRHLRARCAQGGRDGVESSLVSRSLGVKRQQLAHRISKNDSCTRPGHSIGPRRLLLPQPSDLNERSSSVSTWLVQKSVPPRLFHLVPAGE